MTEAKVGTSAVTNTKIANGAVTDAKITGPIAASKIEKPANVITVATSGGDFTTITAALASLPDPNTTPVVIKVMPGTYTEGSITMKSNVHLQGSGRNVTIVDLQGGSISNNGTDNVIVSGFKLIMGKDGLTSWNCNHITISDNWMVGPGTSPWGNGGIFVGGSNLIGTITNNIVQEFSYGIDLGSVYALTVSGNISKWNYYGLYVANGSNETSITGNVFTENTVGIWASGTDNFISGNVISFNTDYGITTAGNNIISGNTISNNGKGIYNSSGRIIGNTMKQNGIGIEGGVGSYPTIMGNDIHGSTTYGIYNVPGSSISNNRITNSGTTDIQDCGGAKVSLNVYDTFSGQPAIGAYNVKQDGTPAPLQ